MKELCLAVFDCDGTIVDSQHAIFHSMGKAFTSHGFAEPDRNAVRRIIGLPLHDAIAGLLPQADFKTIEALRTTYSEEWHLLRADAALEEPLFPGTREVIDELSAAGWLLGVATGKSYRGLVETLKRHQLQERFVTLQTSDKVARGKPYPDMLLAALNEAGVDKHDAVMIGDTTFDIDMSRNAGVRAIGVNWGYHEAGELLARGAECVIDKFEDLHAVLSPENGEIK